MLLKSWAKNCSHYFRLASKFIILYILQLKLSVTVRVCRWTDRMPIKQNEASIPTSNMVILDADLHSINCIYLSDYNLICQNLHNK